MKARFGSSFALLLAAAATSVCAAACTAAPSAADNGDEALTSSGHDDMGPMAFRDVFARYARNEGRSEDEVRQLLLLATPEVVDPGVSLGATAEDTLAAFDVAFQSTKPSDMYTRGVRVPFAPPRDIDAAIAARGGVTFVVLGDGFSELAATLPFADVVNRADSAAATAWRDALGRATDADAHDDAYALSTLAAAATPLGDLVKVASIDHVDGRPLVRVIVLRTPPGSLESASALEAVSPIAMRRLDKAFRVLGGAPSRFYLMGHGRGAAVALDVAVRARADASAHAWATNMAGVVSLGGTVQGSPIADGAAAPATPTGAVFARLGKLASDLRGCESTDTDPERSASVNRNVTTWKAALRELDTMMGALPARDELAWEGFAAATPQTARYAQRLQAFALQAGTTLAPSGAEQCEGIQRFKNAYAALAAGVITETTAARHAWWRTNAVPSGMKLFAAGATMGDPSTSPSAVSPLVASPLGDATVSVDSKSARQDFYELAENTLITSNDGFVPLDHARFWPTLMAQENAAQPALRSYFLGVFASSHAALVHPQVVVTETASGTMNPFPRALMLKSIARFAFEAEARDR